MFVAFNQQHQLTTLLAYQATEIPRLRQQQWFCPQCRQPVFLRAGAACTPHFTHYRRSDCQLAHETATHLVGKQFLYHYFEQRGYQCQLEVFLPVLQQRPDLLLTRGGQQLAVEYQCSPLSLARLKQRTAGYSGSQLPVVWILGPRYIQKNLKNRQLRFLNQSVSLGYYLLFLESSRFLLWHHIQQIGLSPQYGYHVQSLAQTAPATKRQWGQPSLAQQVAYLQRQLQYRQHFWQQLQLVCYRQHRHLLMAPLWCHTLQPTPPILKCSLFALRVYFLLTFEQQPVILPQALTDFRQHYQFLFQPTGRQFAPQQVTVLTALVADLVTQGYLGMAAQGWCWRRQPIWFKSVPDKLAVAAKTRKKTSQEVFD